MQVHTDFQHFSTIQKPIVTTGTFDGVHVGHRKIIQRINDLARQTGGESVVITFHPHPRLVLFPDDNELKLLSTPDEKIQLLANAGVQHLIIIPFTKEFSRLTSHEWVKGYLVDMLHLHTLVIGYDHHFGRNREGGIDQLTQYSADYRFALEEISAQDMDDIKVSSTKIRQALATGDVKTASAFLTYPYTFTGKVVDGDKRGREIGYPTANLKIEDPLKLIPADGVYAVNVTVDNKKHRGMLNIGLRPTVDGKKHTIEVHIFDMDQYLYGKDLTVQLVARIRNEMKFNSLDDLRLQLDKDAQVASKELNVI